MTGSLCSCARQIHEWLPRCHTKAVVSCAVKIDIKQLMINKMLYQMAMCDPHECVCSHA
jgi:hypothetical protein